MDAQSLRDARLRSHRLTAPARSVADAARHLLAVQAQEFWAGRWALAARTTGSPTLRGVDRLFNRGALVRSWTQRGTLHIVPAEDVAWILRATGERQLHAATPRYRELGLNADVLATVERAVVGALRGSNRLTRAELFAVLETAGIETRAQRGLHAIQNLALRGIICQGPVVARPDGASRDQQFVLTDEHITASAAPANPTTELFVRYVTGHGPASPRDFAWWAGLTLGAARGAAEASVDDSRVDRVDDELFQARVRPRRRADAPRVIALGPFEEYYISYDDRTIVCPAQHLGAVGPGKNGMVRAIILRDGVVIGVWRHSNAQGRRTQAPVSELFRADDSGDAEVGAALDRYAAFITG
ncbi:winged helix DNA-binding domain-containing protein [Microbacterium sp.]|uniref:winged helix DNA-binding domain-containing protein n=1 Tax=Microbacterium sp. TaxID=51671 RepID=UPI002632EFD0|nr:winged helix DNA-binding domain-containing protein [Microbacterium sp.]